MKILIQPPRGKGMSVTFPQSVVCVYEVRQRQTQIFNSDCLVKSKRKVALCTKINYNQTIGENMATNNNNINNINNTITTNKHKLKIVPSGQSILLSDSVKEEAKAHKTNHCSQDLPRDWQWMKVDLFDKEWNTSNDARHKINISVCKQSKINHFRALLNSPWTHFRRNLTDAEWSSPHYELVKHTRQALRNAGYRATDIWVSKCYLPGYKQGKGDTVKDLSVIKVNDEKDHRYTAIVIANTHKIMVPLKGDAGYLSSKQRNTGMVATGTAETLLKTSVGVRLDDIL